MTRGFLMFAHNNEEIDYILIALCNALMIKKNLVENNVAVITNKGSYDWLLKSHGKELIDKAFDHVIIQDRPRNSQTRNYRDTQVTTKELSWHNIGRSTAYDLTPFDETVVLDADYLVLDKSLDHVWGSPHEFMMNKNITTLNHTSPHDDEIRLNPFGIPLYWATCFYFRKGELAQNIFHMVEHVRDNYDYYQFLYRFPGKLFRNDYAFSIAIHALAGWVEDGVETLPIPILLTSFDSDELLQVKSLNRLTFLVSQSKDEGKFICSTVDSVNVHIMNKFSIVRCAPDIISLYGDL